MTNVASVGAEEVVVRLATNRSGGNDETEVPVYHVYLGRGLASRMGVEPGGKVTVSVVDPAALCLRLRAVNGDAPERARGQRTVYPMCNGVAVGFWNYPVPQLYRTRHEQERQAMLGDTRAEVTLRNVRYTMVDRVLTLQVQRAVAVNAPAPVATPRQVPLDYEGRVPMAMLYRALARRFEGLQAEMQALGARVEQAKGEVGATLELLASLEETQAEVHDGQE